MKKRKIDKLILVAIISACFSFLALNLARFGFRNYDEHIVNYKEDSKIREVFVESYRELFGSELRLEALHAGLECGLFSEALPGLDAIAVGPTLYNVHTPDENVPLDSFERFYELLKDVLGRLAAA